MRTQVSNGVSKFMLGFMGVSTFALMASVYYLRKTGQLKNVHVLGPDTVAKPGFEGPSPKPAAKE